MKKTNNIYLAIVTLITLLSFVSCEKEIDVDLKSVEPRLVIEASIAKDSLAKVYISKTKNFDGDNIFPPVEGAIVTISDNTGNTEILNQDNNGFYRSKSLKGKENLTYYLNIKYEGKEYTAESTMPQLVNIETITMYYIPSFNYAMPRVEFYDPIGIRNYYRSILYLNGVRMNIGNETTDTQYKDGLYVERILPTFDNDRADSRKVEKGDTVMVELQSIDRGTFKFFYALGRMSSTQNNPTTNIKGGALGYFSAYAFDRKQIIANW